MATFQSGDGRRQAAGVAEIKSGAARISAAQPTRC